MSFFEVKNVSKQFANHLALDDVSLNVEKGKVYGLLGPNGAGKTTLIRIINQITAPDTGEVIFDGVPLEAKHIHNIGYLPEERGLYKKMKVGEQAIYLSRLKGLSKYEARKRLTEWFTKFDILPWWDKKVEELSKGMQQKVQFIITILHQPKLLIFDEPFSGFDPINANLMKNEILNLRDNGSTVIFSTHNMGSVEEICDDIALINKSKKILEGEVRHIKEQFKPNVYEVSYPTIDAPAILRLDSCFTIENDSTVENLRTISVKLPEEESSGRLLKNLVEQVEIKSFKEVLPSMNDIFIELVKGANNE